MIRKTFLTSLRRTVLSLALAAAATTGCAVDDEVERRRVSTSDPAGADPDQSLPDAIDCATACDRIFGGCGGDDPDGIFADENECFEACDSGRLGDQVDCVLETPCAAIARVCFGDESER